MITMSKDSIKFFAKFHRIMMEWSRRIGGHPDDYYIKKLKRLKSPSK
jgi:hypothetical protein